MYPNCLLPSALIYETPPNSWENYTRKQMWKHMNRKSTPSPPPGPRREKNRPQVVSRTSVKYLFHFGNWGSKRQNDLSKVTRTVFMETRTRSPDYLKLTRALPWFTSPAPDIHINPDQPKIVLVDASCPRIIYCFITFFFFFFFSMLSFTLKPSWFRQ